MATIGQPVPVTAASTPPHPQYKKTATTLEYERERFACPKEGGEIDYYRVKVEDLNGVIHFTLSPPILASGFVFLNRKTYAVTIKDLIKGKFHGPSREISLARKVEVDDGVEDALTDAYYQQLVGGTL